MKESRSIFGSLLFAAGVAMVVYFVYSYTAAFLYIPHMAKTPIALTAAERSLLATYKNKPTIESIPEGEYFGKFGAGGVVLESSFRFRDGTLQVDVIPNKGGFEFRASANYQIQGSTLTFSEIKGDRVLIPTEGYPISIEGDTLKIISPDHAPTVLVRFGRTKGLPVQDTSSWPDTDDSILTGIRAGRLAVSALAFFITVPIHYRRR